MSMLYEYFAADSDDVAAQVLSGPGGPRAVAAADGSRFDALDGVEIEPTVNLGDLEELLTGVDYDTVVENPRSGQTLASIDDAGLVIAVTDSLQAALAAVNPDRLFALAGEWSHAEEFGGDVSPGDLARFLTDLAALARRSVERRQRLYCWVSF